MAEARAELGYVDFLRGRYDRAGVWLSQAIAFADGAPLSGQGDHLPRLGRQRSGGYAGEALALLRRGVDLSLAADDGRAAFGLAMLGRVHLLRGELDAAAEQLDAALALAAEAHWFSYVPWPQAMRGEVELARGEVGRAAVLLEQAFARACQLGDPCWEGMAARGLALVADAGGDTAGAFAILVDARRRTTRLADPYVWLDGYILDAQCALGLRHGHPATPDWVDRLNELASRGGMRELRLRALRHGAALGREGDAVAAELLAADVANS